MQKRASEGEVCRQYTCQDIYKWIANPMMDIQNTCQLHTTDALRFQSNKEW